MKKLAHFSASLLFLLPGLVVVAAAGTDAAGSNPTDFPARPIAAASYESAAAGYPGAGAADALHRAGAAADPVETRY